MEFFINCNVSTIAPYNTPLDAMRAAHLYRRLGFSASVETINQAVGQNPNGLVDTLIAQALNAPILPQPIWANWTDANYPQDDDLANQVRNAQREELAIQYGNALLENGLRDRLSFFWSNHFVTELDVYRCNSFLYHYAVALQQHAIGNFKTFVSEIGLTSAMLIYLDGAFNNGNNPNENYARELYELFTLGDGNGYTEEDIVETARALSGYTERGEVGCTMVTFNPTRHDNGTKTIFGRTGNWGYADVMDILFEERGAQIANFICTKLYEFFVHPDCTSDTTNAQTIIDSMAATFVASDFELAPVLSELFKSEHFYDETAIGVIIKSPFDLYMGMLTELGLTPNDQALLSMVSAAQLIGQELFDPIDVAGWQRNRQWINTNFVIGRWLSAEFFISQFFEENKIRFREFGIAAAGPNGATINNPNTIARAIIDKLTPKGLLTEADYTRAITVFRELYEDTSVYDEGSWNMLFPDTESQVFFLLRHLVREPEFQLK